MNKKELAAFCVRILSAENGIWQGVVEAEGEPVPFESELQLIKWLCRKYPSWPWEPNLIRFSQW